MQIKIRVQINENIVALKKLLDKVIKLEIKRDNIPEKIKEDIVRELILLSNEFDLELSGILAIFQIETLEDYLLCEACNCAKLSEDMKSDVDGVPLCESCFNELIEHTLAMEPGTNIVDGVMNDE